MIDAAILKALVSAGATAEMIVLAVEAAQAADLSKLEAKRERDRARKAAQRERDQAACHTESRDVTRTECDKCDTPSPPAPPSPSPPITPLTSSPSPSASPSASLRSAARKRATRISDDWKPSHDLIAYAVAKGMSFERIAIETEKFRDYWLARPGQGGTKLDWAATWRRWVVTALERDPRGQGPPMGGFAPRPGSREDNRERTHHALQKLRTFISTHADDAGGSRDAGGPNAGFLPFAQSSRS